MGTPTIIKGEEYFNTVIYEGNGKGQRVGNFIPFTDQATIANSCIFNDADSARLERTPSSGGNQRVLTVSMWFKLGTLGVRGTLFSAAPSGDTGNFVHQVEILSATQGIRIQGVASGSTVYQLDTNRTFEDTSKFYHILVAYNTGDSTANNRIKLYIDGTQVTSFSTQTNPAQDLDTLFNATSNITAFGILAGSNTNPFDGYMAEVNLVDGQALLPASFGITDTSTGRWIPKTVEPFPTTTTDIAVTVVSSGGNKYALDGVTQGTVTLIEGATYKFDQSDSSNSGHPLRFSTTSDGTHGGGSEFTSGVTTAGTPGSSGAYTQITVPVGTATLYYYCTQHSGMGGTANTQDQYGTNGCRLVFAQSNDLGDDTSGKGNDFAETGLTTSDQTTDSPTLNRNNMGGSNNSFTLSEGNLKVVIPGSGAYNQCVGLESMGVSSGKWYWEVKINTKGASGYGWKSDSNVGGSQALSSGTGSRGTVYNVGGSGGFADGEWTDDFSGATSNFSPFTTASNDDVVMFALDLDNRRGYVGLNGTWFNSANPANGTGSIGLGKVTTHAVTSKFYPMCVRLDASGTGTYNFGGTSFAHTPPTGFLNWNQTTMPEKDEGISSFVWAKNRDNGSYWHSLSDSSRGTNKLLWSNDNSAENATAAGNYANSLNRFLKGGFQTGDYVAMNNSGDSHVAWNWVANKGTTASNTNGSITSTVQANTTAGFSIVQYTGTGSAATIGHGLSTAPTFIAVKNLDDTASWYVYMNVTRSANANTYYMRFDSDDSQSQTGAVWNDTTPTTTVFSVGGEDTSNKASTRFVAYCWTDVDAFSKIGSFSGNNNANGPFVYTGFKPSFLMIKGLNIGNGWTVWDSARSPINPVDTALFWNTSGTDDTGNTIDFLSNGFKLRSSNADFNGSYLYGYMAFAEAPFIGDGVFPVTAR